MSRLDEEEAKKILFEKTPADRVVDSYEDRSFWEFTCRAGGDVLTYRIYDDGDVTER
jgi:hypothetical protein